jgi:hypothetical protein
MKAGPRGGKRSGAGLGKSGWPRKTAEDYEREAEWVGGCLVHPSNHSKARVCYQLRHGVLPKNIFVCHTCDNRHCILDAHHFPGTQSDNMLDAMSKGRIQSNLAKATAAAAIANKGRPMTAANKEILQRMNIGNNYGINSKRYLGKKHSEESKRKIGEASKRIWAEKRKGESCKK